MHAFRAHAGRSLNGEDGQHRPSFLRKPLKRSLNKQHQQEQQQQQHPKKRPRISARKRAQVEFMQQPSQLRRYAAANAITAEMARLAKDFETDPTSLHDTGLPAPSPEGADALTTAPQTIPEACMVETTTTQQQNNNSNSMYGPPRPPPWIQLCDQILASRAATGKGQSSIPPRERVVCRIQNWLYVARYEVDRLGSIRAMRQARMDLLRRRSLRAWADDDDDDDTTAAANARHVRRLRTQGYGDECLRAMLCPAGGPAAAKPLWDTRAPRLSDLALASLAAAAGQTELVAAVARSVAPDPAPRRPQLHLRSLIHGMFPEGARYDLTYFAAMRRATVRPKAESLIHDSGKVVSTGGKTPEESAWTLHKMAERLRAAGSAPVRVDPQRSAMQNIVASVVIPFYVDLRKLARQLGMYCIYRPHSFPGATVRLWEIDKRTKALVYGTSSVMPGAKNVDDLLAALEVVLGHVSARQVAERLLGGNAGGVTGSNSRTTSSSG
jgi:TATA-box binding protein (TBP) (component of TFIID and TFIIIB)